MLRGHLNIFRQGGYKYFNVLVGRGLMIIYHDPTKRCVYETLKTLFLTNHGVASAIESLT